MRQGSALRETERRMEMGMGKGGGRNGLKQGGLICNLEKVRRGLLAGRICKFHGRAAK
jgi:hypothetical protein